MGVAGTGVSVAASGAGSGVKVGVAKSGLGCRVKVGVTDCSATDVDVGVAGVVVGVAASGAGSGVKVAVAKSGLGCGVKAGVTKDGRSGEAGCNLTRNAEQQARMTSRSNKAMTPILTCLLSIGTLGLFDSLPCPQPLLLEKGVGDALSPVGVGDMDQAIPHLSVQAQS